MQMEITQDILDQIGQPESEQLEYKAVLPPAATVAQLIGSFANTKGGAIVLASSGLPARAALMSSKDDITGDRAIRQMLAHHRSRFAEPPTLPKPAPPKPAQTNS